MDLLDILEDDGRIKALKDWPKCWRQTLSGYDIATTQVAGTDTVLKKIKWPDKVRNLELLGKHIDVSAHKEQTSTEYGAYMTSTEYYHPDFGLRMPASPSELGFDFDAFLYINWLSEDKDIQVLLSKAPVGVRQQILMQVLCDNEYFRPLAVIQHSKNASIIFTSAWAAKCLNLPVEV